MKGFLRFGVKEALLMCLQEPRPHSTPTKEIIMLYEAKDGTMQPVFDHPYNSTRLNERGVELACAAAFLMDRPQRRVLEVGNVLQHYPELHALSPGRRIVDRFEEAEGVENVDVFDIKGEFDTIIAISTLEHVGVNDGTNDSLRALDAIRYLQSRLGPIGEMFVTFPFGWNETLDLAWETGILRASSGATYQREESGDWGHMPPDTPPPAYGVTQSWAEGVWVGTFDPLVRLVTLSS